jgi:UDP-N-acetylmuramate dehydrogenase
MNIRYFLWAIRHPARVFLANDLDTLPAAYLAYRLGRAKHLVYDSHEYFTEVPEIQGRFAQRIWRFFERWIFPELKHVSTVNESIAGLYRTRYGVDVNVIKNLPDVSGVEPRADRKTLGLPSGPLLVLQGSDILLTKDIAGFTWHNVIAGIEEVDLGEGRHRLTVGAGVPWHELVMFTVEKGYGGLENMSLIPGSCGAAPMQNIGAYGAEIKDVFYQLEALHLPSGEVHTFGKEECRFAYRESVFKRDKKGEYLIVNITLDLDEHASLNTSYGAISQELEDAGVEPSIRSISEAVIRIRQSKLPDPAKIGNAGSFFKNPVIAEDRFEELLERFPTMPNYPAQSGRKVAAGWLIEQAGWKGKDLGGYGVHDRQALVLVNRGKASGQAIYELSQDIISSVEAIYGIRLEREVNII